MIAQISRGRAGTHKQVAAIGGLQIASKLHAAR